MKALSGDMIPSSVWNKYEAVFEPTPNGSLIEVCADLQENVLNVCSACLTVSHRPVPQVWTSRGTLSDKKASIWANAPLKKGLLDSTRDEFVSLGHVVVSELDNPSNVIKQGGGLFNRGKKPEGDFVSLLELRDRSVLPMQTSQHNALVLKTVMPPPISYRMVSGAHSTQAHTLELLFCPGFLQ